MYSPAEREKTRSVASNHNQQYIAYNAYHLHGSVIYCCVFRIRLGAWSWWIERVLSYGCDFPTDSSLLCSLSDIWDKVWHVVIGTDIETSDSAWRGGADNAASIWREPWCLGVYRGCRETIRTEVNKCAREAGARRWVGMPRRSHHGGKFIAGSGTTASLGRGSWVEFPTGARNATCAVANRCSHRVAKRSAPRQRRCPSGCNGSQWSRAIGFQVLVCLEDKMNYTRAKINSFYQFWPINTFSCIIAMATTLLLSTGYHTHRLVGWAIRSQAIPLAHKFLIGKLCETETHWYIQCVFPCE